ncbi:2-isopropylmalate synthase [Candidatus Woesearchaeota archaeon CG1_02_57_44]|nr:MAG: 2-isopropylmalate synthase [Candidatus Woesearchaeota archaeon CG1_02_57_44]
MNTVRIFDTTLRDGEQTPGVSFTLQEKLMIAKQLERLGVDIIEAGFPIASKGSFDAVHLIAKEVRKPVICGLARTVDKDIKAAAEALKGAERARIHTFIATSDIHRDHKLKKTKEQVAQMARDAVKLARTFTDDVEFSPEDASRTDLDYMCAVVEEAVAAGATTINIPDTVGYAQPQEYEERIRYVQEKVPNIKGLAISTHCHDDLGLSVANSLAAVKAGATQVECTINGIGERAGNTSMEEVVMAIRMRGAYYSATTNINTRELFRTSQMVARFSGITPQRNKAIVGANAFAHQAGIHQHGVISNKRTYEIMDAEDVGWEGENLVIGKLSGKHAIKEALTEAGFELTEDQLLSVTEKVKDLGDKQKSIHRDDVVAIAIDVLSALSPKEDRIKLDELSVFTGNRVTPSSTVGVSIDGQRHIGSATGVGPVDAAAKALKSVIGPGFLLKEYNLKAITGGTDALANVAIKMEDEEHNVFTSEAVDEDVIMASVKAMIKGANKAYHFKTQQDLRQGERHERK